MLDIPLPQTSGRAEKALVVGMLAASDIPVPIRYLWNPETCPAVALPWLAWALSVDEWDAGWTEETKRHVIAESIMIHRQKGTIAGVRRALIAAGLGDAEIIERFGVKFFDSTIPRNGTVDRSRPDHWAEYRVILQKRVSLAQAQVARRIIEAVAPARCRLKELDYRRALNLYGDRMPRDGSYSRGAA